MLKVMSMVESRAHALKIICMRLKWSSCDKSKIHELKVEPQHKSLRELKVGARDLK